MADRIRSQGHPSSDVHARVLQSSENLYAGALQAFEDKRWWWAEMTSGASMGAAAFLTEDSETPDEMRARAEVIYKQALALAERSRAAWVRQQTENRMSGARLKGRRNEAEEIGGFIRSIVHFSVDN